MMLLGNCVLCLLLHGVNEKGELNLTYNMLRVFVTNDKAGVYDAK